MTQQMRFDDDNEAILFVRKKKKDLSQIIGIHLQMCVCHTRIINGRNKQTNEGDERQNYYKMWLHTIRHAQK